LAAQCVAVGVVAVAVAASVMSVAVGFAVGRQVDTGAIIYRLCT